MSKRKISYIIGGICIAACVVVAGIWFLNRNKVKDDAVTVDIRTDTVSAGENEESSWNTDVHGIAKAEGGYYYLQMKSKGMCLYFYDESVQRSIAVCSKAECNHGDVQCNAFFLTSEYLSSPVHYYQGNIYMIKVKNGMGVLTKIQPDGNEREEICELFPNANVTSVSMVFMIMRHMCMTIRDMQAVSRNRMKRLKKLNWTQRKVKIYTLTAVREVQFPGQEALAINYFLKSEHMKLTKIR